MTCPRCAGERWHRVTERGAWVHVWDECIDCGHAATNARLIRWPEMYSDDLTTRLAGLAKYVADGGEP